MLDVAAGSLHDKKLATVLGILNYFARYVNSSSYGAEQIGALPAAISTRWNSQITAAMQALKRRAAIEEFAAHEKAPAAFVERYVRATAKKS